MHIVDLRDGGASLEFSAREADAVSQVLDRLGAKRTARGAVHDMVTVGKDELIYYFEWDEPCLIAKTQSGSKLLRRILAQLSQSKAA
jgi:hypothetical protein